MRGKYYISRTVTYLSIINSGMLLFLFLSKLKELGYINADLDKYFIIIFGLGLFILLIIGWFDVNVIKGFQEESSFSFTLCPPYADMKKKIDELWDEKFVDKD